MTFHLISVRGNSTGLQEIRFSVKDSDDAIVTVNIAGFANTNAGLGIRIGQSRPLAVASIDFNEPEININSLSLESYLPDGSRIRCSGTLTRE